jgi:hypothetical protein
MDLLHVLFAVGVALGLVRTSIIKTRISLRGVRVFVINMSFEFLEGGPSHGRVFTAMLGALMWSAVGLRVFVELK